MLLRILFGFLCYLAVGFLVVVVDAYLDAENYKSDENGTVIVMWPVCLFVLFGMWVMKVPDLIAEKRKDQIRAKRITEHELENIEREVDRMLSAETRPSRSASRRKIKHLPEESN